MSERLVLGRYATIEENRQSGRRGGSTLNQARFPEAAENQAAGAAGGAAVHVRGATAAASGEHVQRRAPGRNFSRKLRRHGSAW